MEFTAVVRHGSVAENGVNTYGESAKSSVKIGVRDSAC